MDFILIKIKLKNGNNLELKNLCTELELAYEKESAEIYNIHSKLFYFKF